MPDLLEVAYGRPTIAAVFDERKCRQHVATAAPSASAAAVGIAALSRCLLLGNIQPQYRDNHAVRTGDVLFTGVLALEILRCVCEFVCLFD